MKTLEYQLSQLERVKNIAGAPASKQKYVLCFIFQDF
jgi:hypothetical protein